jgi:U2-associated protein SR140
LLVKETPVAVKMARLYLLSDILHNSAAPVKHASHYRYGTDRTIDTDR